MAHTILKGLHARAEVSIVEIDAKKNASNINYCGLKNLTIDDATDHVTFDRTDFAVPMPVLKEWRGILPYVDELKDLNDYGLKVTGLKAGKYAITIDGEIVSTHSAEELAGGVNVGLAEKGPIYEQGMKVLAAINAKNGIVHNRFRQVVMFDPRQLPDWVAGPTAEVVRKRREELAKRESQIDEKQAEVYRLAAPTSHRWEIKRAE
jgi:hypothetical protein